MAVQGSAAAKPSSVVAQIVFNCPRVILGLCWDNWLNVLVSWLIPVQHRLNTYEHTPPRTQPHNHRTLTFHTPPHMRSNTYTQAYLTARCVATLKRGRGLAAGAGDGHWDCKAKFQIGFKVGW